MIRKGAFFWGRNRRHRIFISYRRRGDGAGYGGRLADSLVEHFGREQCFRDVDDIESGVDFVETIRRSVAACEVLIVVIGPDWTTQADATGRPRLEDPNDFVRVEVAAALERNIRVIPVLVAGARVPQDDELPDSLKALCRRQAHELTDIRWDYDVDRLMKSIQSIGIPSRSPADLGVRRRRLKLCGCAVAFATVLLGAISLADQLSLWQGLFSAANLAMVQTRDSDRMQQVQEELRQLRLEQEEAERNAEREERAARVRAGWYAQEDNIESDLRVEEFRESLVDEGRVMLDPLCLLFEQAELQEHVPESARQMLNWGVMQYRCQEARVR